MANDCEYSIPDYKDKYRLPPKEPFSIRLIRIKKRIEDVHPTKSKIELQMQVVNLHSSQLLPGESAKPTGRPSVRFDEEMNVERPKEYFCIPRSSMMPSSHPSQAQQQPEKKDRGKLSRLAAKLKPKPGPQKEDPTLVPLSDFPEGEPKVRNRFTWGNYVAMSYTCGKKEEWEITDKDRKEAAEKEEEEREEKRKDPAYKPLVVEEDENLTYTDGDVHEVLLDDQRIRVRYNLWAALLAFRELAPFKEGMWLWNDALCINQHKTKAGREEKESQIRLMSVIYRQAGNIIIHAGGGWFHEDDTPWVFDYLQRIGANYRTEYYEALDHAEPAIAHSHRFSARLMLEKSAREWVEGAQADIRKPARQGDIDYAMISLYDFFDRPYWRRLWIIQELAMAHHSAPILCGDFVTQWRYIRDGALLLCMMADTVRDAMQRALERDRRTMKREPSFEHVAAIAELAVFGKSNVVPHTDSLVLMPPGVIGVESHSGHSAFTVTDVRMPLMKTLPRSPIQQSLTLAAGAHCERKRDRVLGLLAIPALSTLPLQNDATLRDVPTTDIYLKYAQECIKADHSLDIFSLVEGGFTELDKGRHFPSWCPCFHIKSKIGRIEGDWHAQPTRPKYDPVDLSSIEFEEEMGPQFEGDNMLCPGWIIDTVDGLGAVSASDMPSMAPGRLFKGGIVLPRFHPNWSAVKEVPASYSYFGSKPAVQAIPDQIWSALVGGTGTYGKKAPSSFSCLLDSFPGSWPRNNGFQYKRNWDFIQANRDFPIAGKPLSSYFTFQAAENFSHAAISHPVEHTYHQVAEAHRAMEARTKFRRLMTTSNRPLMGLVPVTTQPGDYVIILWYHSRPLIASAFLRNGAPEGSEDYMFKLKGEAFIPGVMDGELAEELDARPMYRFKFT